MTDSQQSRTAPIDGSTGTDGTALPSVLRLSDGTVDLRLGEVLRAGGATRLTTKELDLLRYLAARAGQAVTRDQLLTEVWGHARPRLTRAVHTAVKRLRAKIEQDPAAPRHVLTVHGEGYRFEEAAPSDSMAPPVAAPAPQGSGHPAVPLSLSAGDPSPPLSLIHGPGTNLGTELNELVGRGEELSQVRGAARRGGRLVTLLGPGGVGKTRLAREHARRSFDRGELPGGAWFVDCAEATRAELFAHAIAGALDLPPAPGLDLEDDLKRIGRQLIRGGAALVILDNLEQSVAEAARVVQLLLSHSSSLSILGTTRVRLDLPGEQVLELGALSEDEALELFVRRAQDADSGQQLTEPETEDARQLVRELDGLPLAIELAATWCSVLRPADLLERLADRFRLLARGRAAPGDRHGTLRATLDASWELLEPSDRRALAQASVFRGGFDLAAAEAVLEVEGADGPVWAPEQLRRLRDRSLLLAGSGPGALRFRMYEMVREYARLRLEESGEGPAARERHRRWCLDLALELGRQVRCGGPPRPVQRLGLELDNILAAFDGALQEAPETAVDLAAALEPVSWGLRLTESELKALLEQALEAAGDPGTEGALRARKVRAWLVRWQLPYEQLKEELDDVATRARVASWPLLEASAQHGLGTLANLHGHRQDAIASLLEAEQGFAELEGPLAVSGHARTLATLATVYSFEGELDRARETFDRSIVLSQKACDRKTEAASRTNLSQLLIRQGRHSQAFAELGQALALLVELGDRIREAAVLALLASFELHQGELAPAAERLEAALELCQAVGDTMWEGHCLVLIGRTLLEQGRGPEAVERAEEALSLHRAEGQRRMEAYALGTLMLCRLEMGSHALGVEEGRTSLAILEELGDHQTAHLVRCHLATLLAMEGELAEAEELLSTDHPGGTSEVAVTAALLARAEVDLHRAAKAEAEGDTPGAGKLREGALRALERATRSSLLGPDRPPARMCMQCNRMAGRRIEAGLDRHS